jgi:topoisomerase IV subunit A
MAFVKNLFDKNFIEYASYVIRDRAIPDLIDGLKPVQRRILHTLFEIDDGKFHKVANVVGQCMKYHPHGDASIGDALVVLANKEIFIDKQGNFGNMFTGDRASAVRYIECRIKPLARDILYNPDITEYVPSYDGRSHEPVVFRAKLPLILILGAEGIAVGMNTRIMSHNCREVIEAEKNCLLGKKFQLYPDFPTGGFMDVSDYRDGNGKIITRAKFDLRDDKTIVITELPYGSNTETLITSIENAAKSGKVKISSINDYTSDHVEIEIKLQRGIYAKDVVDALYAYTDCEQSVSCNLLVIKGNMPVVMSVTDVIEYHAKQLIAVLKDELELESRTLREKLHMRTLERIFIEERIYKTIEDMKTQGTVVAAVLKGFILYRADLVRDVTPDDVDQLLKIPIRRISLYDISKNRDEVTAINARLKEIDRLLKHLTEYAVAYLDGILAKLNPVETVRHTAVASFHAVDVKEIAQRDMPLRYDEKGYLGTNVSGGMELFRVSPFDRILCIRKNGMYAVSETPEKVFVDRNIWYCGFADKESLSQVLFTILYRDPLSKMAYIKRVHIGGYIMNRDYLIIPDGMEVLHIDTRPSFTFTLEYEKKGRTKIIQEQFKSASYPEKGLKTLGVRIALREVVRVVIDNCAPRSLFEGQDND